MIMFLIKLLSIIVFDLCTNMCCIYSVCKNCCKDDAIKKTNSLNENFLKSIEIKKDGKVYYNGLSQCFDQIDRDQVEGIVNPEYSETVFFYGINKELYSSITRKSYIKFKGSKNIKEYKKKSVKKNIKDQESFAEKEVENSNNKEIKEDEDIKENNENKKENENENKNKNENEIKTLVKVEKEDGVNFNNIENENKTQNKDNRNQKNQETNIGETEGDYCSNIGLYSNVFKECEVVMDKFVLFAVKTQGGNCYLGFCRDGNSKEIVNEDGSKDIVGLFKGSKKNVEVKIISCGEKLENVQYMFSDNTNLKNIVFTPLFVVSYVENMSFMFSGCSELKELDLSNFISASTSGKNIIKVTSMFSNCKNLKDLRFPDFGNNKFFPMCYTMFDGCTSLRKCNLVVNDDNIINSFEICSKLGMKNTELVKNTNYENISEDSISEGKGDIVTYINDKGFADKNKFINEVKKVNFQS